MKTHRAVFDTFFWLGLLLILLPALAVWWHGHKRALKKIK